MGRNFNIMLILSAVAAVGALVVGSKQNSITFVNYFGKPERLPASYPRGVRNNNPGNLRVTKITWKNKLPLSQNTDKSFEQFYTYTDGVRALMIDVKTKIAKYKTIGAILVIYAPISENNTAAYIASVEKKLGIKRDAILPLNEKIIKGLAMAIIEVENGKAYYTPEIINNAYKSL